MRLPREVLIKLKDFECQKKHAYNAYKGKCLIFIVPDSRDSTYWKPGLYETVVDKKQSVFQASVFQVKTIII